MRSIYIRLLISINIIFIMAGCSSLQSRSKFHQAGPYPGVRYISENYSEGEWGPARIPAMIVDLPFSAVMDTLTLPFDAWE